MHGRWRDPSAAAIKSVPVGGFDFVHALVPPLTGLVSMPFPAIHHYRRSPPCWRIKTNTKYFSACLLSYKDQMVRPVGFEPTTLGLEGRCSILLS